MLSAKEDFKLGLQYFRGIELSTAVGSGLMGLAYLELPDLIPVTNI